jgi:uncharacterized DUF497 family protein
MSKFDWDQGNREKCARRVSIEEIEALIDDRRTLIAGDPYGGETRFRAVGHNSAGKPLFVVLHDARERVANSTYGRSARAISIGAESDEKAVP